MPKHAAWELTVWGFLKEKKKLDASQVPLADIYK